jgi:PAS domain S-box-containing protein
MHATLAAPANHVVQVFADEQVLHAAVAAFLREGLDRDEPVVVVATRAHREAFAKALGDRASRVTMIDARATLASIMVDGMPDAVGFERAIGATFERLSGGRPKTMRAYGEMAELLSLDGEVEAALALEELWSGFARSYTFALLRASVSSQPRLRAIAQRQRVDAESFRMLVEAVDGYAIFMLDPHGNVQTWNTGAQRIKGYSAHDILGRHFSTFYPPELVAVGKCEQLLEEAARVGKVEDQGWRVRKDGTRFWASVLLTAIRAENGALVGFAKVTRDLTPQRVAEEERLGRMAAERSVRLLERIQTVTGALAAARTPLDVARIIVDQGRLVLHADAGVLARSAEDGASLDLVAWSGIGDDVAEQWKRFSTAIEAPITNAFRTGTPQWEDDPERFEATRGNGTKAYVCLPLVATSGTIGVVGFRFAERRSFAPEERSLLETMAAQTAMALERAEAAAQVEQANGMKDEFLAVVSHELRTPLNAIVGWSSILKTQRDPATVAKGVDAIYRNSTAQSRLIEDLLDVSRIIAGKLTIDPSETDLVLAVHEAVEVVGRAGNEKRHVIEVETGTEPLVIDADRGRLQQVLLNLLTNAIKFTEPGGSVSIRACRRDNLAEVVVADTGMGIDPAFLPHVFDRFRQGSYAMTRRGGLGLGLAIVKHIVELHGGSVTAASEGLGRGSRFVLHFPLGGAMGSRTAI